MDNTVIDSSLRTVEWKDNIVMIDQTKLLVYLNVIC